MTTHLSRLAAVAFFSVGCAQAADYTFTNVARAASVGDPTPILSLPTNPSINEFGTVAFFAFLNERFDAQAIFTGNSGELTTIANDSDPLFGSFKTLGLQPSINSAGVVAFYATLDGANDGEPGIFTGTGGPATTIVRATTSQFRDFSTAPAINDAGTVAFQGTFDNLDGNGIYTSIGGSITPVFVSQPQPELISIDPAINAAGDVAFEVSTGVYRGNGGPLTTIAREGATFSNFGNNSPSINDAGRVAFIGVLLPNNDTGVFTGNGGPLTPVALSSGPVFSLLDAVSINNRGQLAFRGFFENSEDNGIFTGPDPVRDRVIGTGDSLFGGTVQSVRIGNEALNDAGQIAFFYQLEDGREGIAIANVPEPAGLMSLAAGAAVLTLRRARRGRKHAVGNVSPPAA